MAKIIIKDGDVADGFRRFSRITNETRKDAKRHEYYLRPGLRAKEKSKEAAKTAKRYA